MALPANSFLDKVALATKYVALTRTNSFAVTPTASNFIQSYVYDRDNELLFLKMADSSIRAYRGITPYQTHSLGNAAPKGQVQFDKVIYADLLSPNLATAYAAIDITTQVAAIP